MVRDADPTDMVPPDYRYLQSHEWHQVAGDSVTIGITQIAADELTDITFVSLPKIGTKVHANQRFGELESGNGPSYLYSGVSGTVNAINDQLTASPGLVNSDPYKAGWMIKVKPDDPAQVNQL